MASPSRTQSLQEFKQSYFFRWLKGDYDHLGVWHFPPENVPQDDSTQDENTTELDTISEANPDTQPFLCFKQRAESIALDVGNRAKLVFTASPEFTLILFHVWESDSPATEDHKTGQIPQTSRVESRFFCDGCDRRILETEHGFHCCICNNDDFDLCQDCVDRGSKCKDGSHLLSMTVGYGQRGGRAVRIFGSRNILKGLRSPPGLQWVDGTLLSALESYLAHVDTSSHPRAEEFRLKNTSSSSPMACFGPMNMLQSWAQLCVLLTEDGLVPLFRTMLTPLQLATVRLLLEWWMGEIQDYRLTLMGIHGVWIHKSVKAKNSAETVEELFATHQFVCGCEKSRYHDRLLRLFCTEFTHTPPVSEGPDQKPALYSNREAAARLASAQRAAVRLRHPLPIPPWLGDTDGDNITAISHAAFTRYRKMFMTSGIPLAYINPTDDVAESYLDAFNQACKGSALLATENFLSFEQLLGKNNLSPSLIPYPWLSRAKAFSDRPYFLRDVRKRKTVRVTDMQFESIYTAISHTWGRWRLNGESADIPGVLWPVPRNTRFPVELIPTILEGVPGCSPYIFFDLVCIPQDTVQGPEMDELRRQEVARQAGTFNNAEHAVAWFSDVQNIEPLRMMTQVLAMDALKFPPIVDNPDLWKARLRWETRSFYVHPLMKVDKPEYEPEHDRLVGETWQENVHEWFTSLWTLQEVCMRPDMWICGKDWETLVLPIDTPTKPRGILSMDALFSLLCLTHGTSEKLENMEPIWAEKEVVRSSTWFHYGNSSPCGSIVKRMPWVV